MSAFQRHMVHFATPSNPYVITLGSGLRGSLALGLNFPISCLLSLALRIMYSPFPWTSPISIASIPTPKHRTQLEHVQLYQAEYSCTDLLRLYALQEHDAKSRSSIENLAASLIDRGHIIGFWVMAANASTHKVFREDVEQFQRGDWEKDVVKRRQGVHDILPFWRGGPLFVSGHSWAVAKLFGVQVYDTNILSKEKKIR
ncbi:hypothetical protein EJ05DRAFT_436759 [Pseudovirgaria hyperparasitica]|uniref:Uncharacterized protein n=1 Tax=Pseudovirgaria hyperparasitica TaxID=470096 RepID=A0A6A6WEN1_9PEZI|nr:uncharacterized protein EJ05DRAFT_436759 [Pseudovirgaria hyperparasitica]KAF2759571.1 hypothetical protein EJ05DRAFT_436759 [Pseudovirgaria hyperparasitica]